MVSHTQLQTALKVNESRRTTGHPDFGVPFGQNLIAQIIVAWRAFRRKSQGAGIAVCALATGEEKARSSDVRQNGTLAIERLRPAIAFRDFPEVRAIGVAIRVGEVRRIAQVERLCPELHI